MTIRARLLLASLLAACGAPQPQGGADLAEVDARSQGDAALFAPDAAPVDSALPVDSAGGDAPPAPGAIHKIYIHAYLFSFSPTPYPIGTSHLSLTIPAGDTVEWDWSSDYPGPGRVVSGTLCAVDPSPVVDSGTHTYPYSYSYTFAKTGTFLYIDVNHCDSTWMQAQIVVQ